MEKSYNNQCRYRPYNYDENQKRENSRKRKNRIQLRLNNDDLAIINTRMKEFGIDNLSEFIRLLTCYGSISGNILENNNKRDLRKQICFSEEEINIMNSRMAEFGIDNLNSYIRIAACHGVISK